MNDNYCTVERPPSLAEYKQICHAVGWGAFMPFERAEEALKRSLFGVVVEYRGEAVGMGRVVGDGCMYFYVQDVAVKPEHQGQGVGRAIMKAITNYISRHAPEKSFVGLFAAQGKEHFYQAHGFNRHEALTGMFGVVHGQEIK